MMMDLPRIQVTATPALSRKRARDSQDLQSDGSKVHTYYTVRGHASWDAAHQLSVHDSQDDEADEDLIPAPASPRSVSSSSTWKRRRVSELHDDSELELEYVDSVPPSPWIDSHQQPSPLELTECTTPNEDQDLPKERKRHREEWEVLKGLYMEAIVAYGCECLLETPVCFRHSDLFIQLTMIPRRLSTFSELSLRNAMNFWWSTRTPPFSSCLWYAMWMEVGHLKICLHRMSVCSGAGAANTQTTQSCLLQRCEKTIPTRLLSC